MTELNQDKQHYYAGIGSRQTPDIILDDMQHIASVLDRQRRTHPRASRSRALRGPTVFRQLEIT